MKKFFASHYGWQPKAAAFTPHAFDKKIELLGELPRVLVSRGAYNKMWHLVDLADKEVGWLGTVRKDGADFLIEEVFLFRQEVSGTTCEISADGLAEFAQEVLTSRPDGMEVCNKLCFWGHSHVRMGTSPSGQDEEQMKIFSSSGHQFFIRGILNKNGRMEFTIFLHESGVKIVDPEWSIYEPVDASIRAEIEAEFAAKVSEKVSPAYGGGYSGHYGRGIGDDGDESLSPIAGYSAPGEPKKQKGGRYGR